jgi:hypothetical protein
LHNRLAINFDVVGARQFHEHGTNLLFIGVEPDVSVAKQMFEYLYHFVDVYDYRGLTTADRYDWRLGFVRAVDKRLREKKEEQNANAHITALVLCKKQIANDFVSSKYTKRTHSKAKLRPVGMAYHDGYRVGQQIPLNRPLDENNTAALTGK